MIRNATAGDVAAVVALEEESLGDDAWSASLVEDGVRGGLPTIRYLVAEREGDVVGYAVASLSGDIAELQRIAVTPGRRRTGVAGELLEAVMAAARAARCDRLLLEVRDDNHAALSFYAAAHFVEIDRRRRYYRDGTTAVVLRRGVLRGCGGD